MQINNSPTVDFLNSLQLKTQKADIFNIYEFRDEAQNNRVALSLVVYQDKLVVTSSEGVSVYQFEGVSVDINRIADMRLNHFHNYCVASPIGRKPVEFLEKDLKDRAIEKIQNFVLEYQNDFVYEGEPAEWIGAEESAYREPNADEFEAWVDDEDVSQFGIKLPFSKSEVANILLKMHFDTSIEAIVANWGNVTSDEIRKWFLQSNSELASRMSAHGIYPTQGGTSMAGFVALHHEAAKAVAKRLKKYEPLADTGEIVWKIG